MLVAAAAVVAAAAAALQLPPWLTSLAVLLRRVRWRSGVAAVAAAAAVAVVAAAVLASRPRRQLKPSLSRVTPLLARP